MSIEMNFPTMNPTRWILAGVAALVLLIVGIWFKDAIGGQVENFNRWQHDKAIAAERQEIQRLTDENAKLLQEAKTAYALGSAKELEADALYAELAKYGAGAKAAAEAQKKASEEYEKNKAAIDIDVPLFERCKNLCSERAEVGYGCRPSPEDYCRRYSTGQ